MAYNQRMIKKYFGQFKAMPLTIGLFAALLVAAIATGGNGWVKLDPADSEAEVVRKAVSARPSPRQLEWQKVEFALFFHFGMNTFTNREWGNGREDPKLFNPTAFDARQWVAVARAAGARMIIVTAKHHDGFCLWPSKVTEHSVKRSPWRDGRGDVVAEVAAACREAGLKFGVYLSPWDRHEPTYGTPAYNDYYQAQLRELLQNYGPIADVWMDGAGRGRRWKKMLELYDWDGYFKLIRELAPQATISIRGPDVRWVGNEAGRGRGSEWSVVPEQIVETAADLGSREQFMLAASRGERLHWYPAQVDVSIRPGWFYHASQDRMVKSLDQLVKIYFASVGNNAQLLLNLPPDQRGLVHENDLRACRELGERLQKIFALNLARNAIASASSIRSDGAHPAALVVDGDPDTYWMPDDNVTAATLELDLGEPKSFNVAMIQEYLPEGQRVEEFYLEAFDGGSWQPVARATTIGYERLLRFPRVTAQRVRARITGSRAAPAIANFGLFDDASATP